MAEQTASWQENKTVLERNQYIFQNEIETDVCFEAYSDNGSIELIRGHKLMLLSASPVFEAMFCGGMAEAQSGYGNIKIVDIDASVFKEMLRFIFA